MDAMNTHAGEMQIGTSPGPIALQVAAEAAPPRNDRQKAKRTGERPKLAAVAEAIAAHKDHTHPAVVAAMDEHTQKSAAWMFGEVLAPAAGLDPEWLEVRAAYIAARSTFETMSIFSDLHAYGLEYDGAEEIYDRYSDEADNAAKTALKFPPRDQATLADKAAVLAQDADFFEAYAFYEDDPIATVIASDLHSLQREAPRLAKSSPISSALATLAAAKEHFKAAGAAGYDDSGNVWLGESIQDQGDHALFQVHETPCTTAGDARTKLEAIALELKRSEGGDLSGRVDRLIDSIALISDWLALGTTDLAGQDVELVQIGDRYAELEREINEIEDVGTTLSAQLDELNPPEPEHLRVRRDDHGISILTPPEFHDWESVYRLRGLKEKWKANIASDPWFAHLQRHVDRAEEIISAWEGWQAQIDEIRISIGLRENSLKLDALIEEQDALFQRVIALEGRTVAGFRAKAMIASHMAIPEDLGAVEDYPQRLAYSLVRDIAKAGTAA